MDSLIQEVYAEVFGMAEAEIVSIVSATSGEVA